jgi:beta-glucanase (GH16 family)
MHQFKNLVFERNFDQDGQLNINDFNIVVGDRWANNEKQCYVRSDDTCFIRNGRLTLKAHKSNDHCKYVSARINTANKHHFQYGRFVVRAKMPKGKGAWPAVWFLSVDQLNGVRWPLCGEIDLLEYAANRPHQVTASLHSKTYNHKDNTDKTGIAYVKDLDESFHDFELIWTESSVTYLVDGQVFAHFEKQTGDTENEWPFNKPYYMIINLAVGGWYGGDIDDDAFPFVFEIDSIRIYK